MNRYKVSIGLRAPDASRIDEHIAPLLFDAESSDAAAKAYVDAQMTLSDPPRAIFVQRVDDAEGPYAIRKYEAQKVVAADVKLVERDCGRMTITSPTRLKEQRSALPVTGAATHLKEKS